MKIVRDSKLCDSLSRFSETTKCVLFIETASGIMVMTFVTAGDPIKQKEHRRDYSHRR